MKTILAIICSLFLFCVTGYAAESFDSGWEEDIEGGGTGTFSPSGTTLSFSGTSFSGSDNYFWGGYFKTSGTAFGAAATFNVSSSSSSDSSHYSMCGIRKYVAYTTTGTRILAEIYLAESDGVKTVRYRVREREADSTTTVEQAAYGYIGAVNSDAWTTGEDITLSLAMRDNIIYFGCSQYSDEVVKIDLDDIVSEEIESTPYLMVDAEQGASIQGTISDFTLSSKIFYIPHVTSNATWTDYIQADNNSDTDASFTLTLYDASGTQVYSATDDVEANSETVIQPKSVSSEARLGVITCTNHLVFFRYSYENDNGGVAEFKLTNEAYGSAGFWV